MSKNPQPVLLILGRFTPNAENHLKQNLNQYNIVRKPQWSEAETYADQVEILLIRSDTKIDHNILKQTPNLKLIISSTSGFDHINLELTEKKSIQVMHTPAANAQSAAELTWALILAQAKKINKAQQIANQVTWPRTDLVGMELKNLSLGVIGYGRVGKIVASIGKAFGMKVFIYDPYADITAQDSVTVLGFEECLKMSDVISFHVPLTKKTKNMINKFSLDSVQEHAILVNCSRGEIINESDLTLFMRKNLNFKAAFDVFNQEPLPADHPLRSEPHLIMTPHIGATTESALKNSCFEAAQKAIDFVLQKKTTDSLPPSSPWWLDR